MFVIECRRCRADVLVGDSQLVAVHRTCDGFIVYARCPCGRIAITPVTGRRPASAPGREPGRRYGLTA